MTFWLVKPLDSLKKKGIIKYEVMIFIFFLLIYIFILNKIFNYGVMHFDLEISLFKVSVVFVLLVLLLSSSRLIRNDFVFSVWHIIFVYIFFPTTIYFMFNSGSYLPTISITLLLILLAVFSNMKVIEFSKINNGKETSNYFIIILFVLSIIMLIPFILYYRGSIDISNLFLIDVYETRLEFREISNPLIGYTQNPLVRVIFPILFIKSLERRNTFLLTYCIASMLYIFLCGALKSNLLIIGLIIFFYFGKNYITKLNMFLKGIMWVSFASIIEYFILGKTFFVDTIIRRVFFVPSMIDNTFYKFFHNSHLYWSYTKIGSLINPNEEVGRSVSRYVGSQVTGNNNVNSNVGILTEGYTSAGMIGVLFYALIIVLIIIYVRSIDLDPKYFGVFFFNVYLINTSFLEPALITHGLLYFLIAAPFFMNRIRNNESTKFQFQREKS